MTQNWEQHKWIFEPDGSLLDIYVQETTITDWLTLIDFLNVNCKLKYGPTDNESAANINKNYIQQLLTDTTGELERKSVSIYFDSLIFNCYFFLKEEIEFDADPKEFKGQHDFETIIKFMNAVSKLLNKEVILTAEGVTDKPLITIDYKNNLLKIVTQEELKEQYKKSITWTGRLRGYYVFSLMRLLPKLKSSKFKNWLTDYVIKLTNATKPHTATKK